MLINKKKREFHIVGQQQPSKFIGGVQVSKWKQKGNKIKTTSAIYL